MDRWMGAGETDATDNDFTALVRPARNDLTTTAQPLVPVTEPRFETGWNLHRWMQRERARA
eukprot:2972414-Pleurochrysis_carterae.AAC.1